MCRFRPLLISLLLLFLVAPMAAGSDYPSLDLCTDNELQQRLESSLACLKLERAVAERDLSVALVDITELAAPRLAMVNGNQMMYAASLPKIAILFGAFERIAKGELAFDTRLRQALTQMIRFSSNRAATEILNLVGKPYLARLLQSPAYRLYDPERGGGLWVGKDYGKAPAWQRDPLHQLSHGATAFQVARFYYLLETGRLVSPEMSREMKQILGDPGIRHKFVKGLADSSPEARIYRKSGTWGEFHADSAIVEHNGRRYIAVALARNPSGSQWLSSLIVALDDLICHPVPPPDALAHLAH